MAGQEYGWTYQGYQKLRYFKEIKRKNQKVENKQEETL